MPLTPPAAARERYRRKEARRRTETLLVTDAAAWIGGFLAAAWTRFEFGLTGSQLSKTICVGLVAAVLHHAVDVLRRAYLGRHPLGSPAELRALAGTAAGTAGLVLVAILPMPLRPVPASTPAVGAALALVLMVAARARYRQRHERSLRPDARSAEPVLLFGLGAAGQGLLRAMVTDPQGGYLPVGLLDDDPEKRDVRLEGVRMLGGRRELPAVIARTGASAVVFSLDTADPELVREVREATVRAGAAFTVLPPVRDLLHRRISGADVRDVDIADLLGRRPVVADLAVRGAGLTGRRILVTGAGGSVGAELCRQIMRADPGELMLLDRDESALYALQLSLSGDAPLDGPQPILADLRDSERTARIIAERRPEIVFHAAALQHLTLLQRDPGEAVKTNVWGTLSVLNACRDVGTFVNFSSVKAANPTSVVGYTKRITERLTAHAAGVTGGAFLSVRLGNVLGNRGSVITAFRVQIAAGLPLTVTHPEVTRYFMTAQEAGQLALRAAATGRGGEALVLDMGEPVRIDDIARQLAGHAARPVRFVYTGLRPGEKLHDDLLGDGEEDVRPRHPLVSQVPIPPLDPAEVRALDPVDDPEKVIDRLAWLCGQPAELTG